MYDLTSYSVNQLVNSWSLVTRHMWGLPYQARRYLIEELGGQHAIAQSMLTIRDVKFLQSLKRSPKRCVQFLLEKVSRNVNTVTGRNMRYILDKTENRCDVFSLTQNIKKKSLKFFEILDEDKYQTGCPNT